MRLTRLSFDGRRMRIDGAWLVSVIAPEILGYGAIAVELGDSPGERTGRSRNASNCLKRRP